MATKIQIKRTNTGAIPSSVNSGELVYVYNGEGAATTHKEKLFIGDFAGQNYQAVGGKFFTDMLNVTAGAVTAGKAIVLDSNKKIDEFSVDNIKIDGNNITTTNTDGDLSLLPDNAGFTIIKNPKISIGGVVTELTEFVQDNSGGTLTQDAGQTIDITYNDSAGTTTLGIADGKVGTTQLENGGVTAAKLAADAVETAKIKDANVTGVKLADGAVTSAKIGTDQVDNTHLATNSVDAEQIKTNAVTSDKIAAGAVVGTKIGADAIDDTKIADNAVKNEHLANDAVGTTEIANLAVTGAKIAATTIQGTNIQNGAIDSAQLATGSVRGTDSINGAQEIAASTITVAELANDAVETNKIKDGAVSAAKLADSIITSSHIVNGTIETADIKNNAITSAKIADDAVDTTEIKNGAVTEAKINAGAVSHVKLAVDAVESDNIKDANVTHAKLATDAVEVDNIKDATITGTKIAANTITATNIAGNEITAAEIAAGTITNTEIANATIENAKLVNNSIKIGSTTIALGTTGATDIAGITSLVVDNISVNGNTIVTNDNTTALVLETLNNQNISLAPNGDGTVAVPSNYNTRTGFGDDSLTNKKYVDAVAAGLAIKNAVKVATTVELTGVTYTNSAGTIASNTNAALVIDGHTVLQGERVLVKNQTADGGGTTNAVQNGIYTLTTVGNTSPGVAWVLTRADDANTDAELPGGAFFFVEVGSINGDAGFVTTHNGTPTLGNTAIAFTQFSGAGTIIAGDAMGKVGNTLNVKFDGVTIEQNADALRVKDGAIDNDKVKAATISGSFGSSGYTTSGILQSKLAMNAAVATKSTATGITESDLGIAHFDANQFTVTAGFATVSALDGGTY